MVNIKHICMHTPLKLHEAFVHFVCSSQETQDGMLGLDWAWGQTLDIPAVINSFHNTVSDNKLPNRDFFLISDRNGLKKVKIVFVIVLVLYLLLDILVYMLLGIYPSTKSKEHTQ